MKQQMEKQRAKNEICTKFLLRFFKLVSKYKITSYNYNQTIITIHFFAVFFFSVTVLHLSAKKNYGRLFALNQEKYCEICFRWGPLSVILAIANPQHTRDRLSNLSRTYVLPLLNKFMEEYLLQN